MDTKPASSLYRCGGRPRFRSRRSLFAVGILTALVLPGMAGCGGGGSNSSRAAIASAAPTPVPTPTPTPTPTPMPTPTPVPVRVTVSPAAATVSIGDTITFTASVSGTADSTVVWSISESGGGAITSEGTYTAPDTPGTYRIFATSRADSAKQGQATVTVQAGGASGTIQ